MLRAAALVAMLSPLAFCLATRQDPGPCDVNACHAVIDSSACWNAYVTGAIREELTGIYDCAPGGKSELCGCSGCDSLLHRFLLQNGLCGNTSTPRRPAAASER